MWPQIYAEVAAPPLKYPRFLWAQDRSFPIPEFWVSFFWSSATADHGKTTKATAYGRAPRNTALTQLEVEAQKMAAVECLVGAPALAGARLGARRERVRVVAAGVVIQGTHDARAQPLLHHAPQAVPHALTCERSRGSEIGSLRAVYGSLRNNRTWTMATNVARRAKVPT